MFRQFTIFLWLIWISRCDECDSWLDSNDINMDFLTETQLRMVCRHRRQWQKDRDGHASESFLRDKSTSQKAYLAAIEKCTRSNCVHQARRRKRAPSKTIRKEIRMMSREELDNLSKAMNALKSKTIDNITAWDLHTLVHYPDSAPGAHWGPAFLPWHREFLRQFEIALQNEVPEVALPYWDSTLDQGIPEESDSVLWTDELLGNGNGYVKTGPFADWNTNVLMPLTQIPVKKLYRSTGSREQDRLLMQRDINWITSRKNFSQLTFCHDKTFESMHGLSHVWVGGFMFVIKVSPNDPTFYMHHAFVDYIWEQFRQRMQTRAERETQWADKICNDNHGFDVQMKPFTIQNRDGLSNQYTDEWYEYQPVRHCSRANPTCDSKYYWCDQSLWRCRSRIVFGGNCTGFEGTEICYDSFCAKGECILPPRLRKALKNRLEDENYSKWNDVIWTKTLMVDSEGNGLRDEMGRIIVTDLQNNESSTNFLSETDGFPELPGTVYLGLPKPHGSTMKVSLEARDQFDRYCQAQCYNHTTERYQVCQPILSYSSDADSSDKLSYTHSMTSRRFLDVDLSVHPRQVTVTPPYIVFTCSRKLVTSAMIQAASGKERPPLPAEQSVWFRVSIIRQSSEDLQIEVKPDFGDIWSSSLLKVQSSFDPTVVFVQAPNPELNRGGVKVVVSLFSFGKRKQCTIRCTKKDGSVRRCSGEVELHADPALSEEDVFTSDPKALPLLGWNMNSHPSLWRYKVPYLSFEC